MVRVVSESRRLSTYTKYREDSHYNPTLEVPWAWSIQRPISTISYGEKFPITSSGIHYFLSQKRRSPNLDQSRHLALISHPASTKSVGKFRNKFLIWSRNLEVQNPCHQIS